MTHPISAAFGPTLRASLALIALLTTSPATADAPPKDATKPPVSAEAVDAKVEVLASEINALRERLVIPESQALVSRYGMGPAASKVYGGTPGLSLGGYGEFYLGHFLGSDDERKPHRGDTYRFITYLGYKFDERIVMNAEIEFEHATTGKNPENGEGGSVSVEFAYLDFLLSSYANLRTGLMLMPVGITNEMHEPTTYHGNFRPEVERRIIPSTWREAGIGLFGDLGAGLSYKAYLTNGLSARGFGGKGIRGGRQKGNHVVWEDKAATLRLDWRWSDQIDLGASLFYGGADQSIKDDPSVTALVFEGHSIVRFAGLELRGLYAESHIDGGDRIHELTGAEEPAGVPTVQRGFYATVAYDVSRLIASTPPGMSLSPFVRYEWMDLQAEMPDGLESDPALATTEITAGLQYQPHPEVVLKGELSRRTSDADEKTSPTVEELRLGAGFIF